MAKVIAICGKICCGKSYYAAGLKEKENAVILSCDELTKDLFDNDLGDKHDEMALRIWAYFRKKSVELVNAGCTVILDWGFWSRENRSVLKEFYREQNIPCEWHYVDVDEETWKRNIAERNRRILDGEGGSDYFLDEGLMKKLLSLWEDPAKEEIDVWYKPVRERQAVDERLKRIRESERKSHEEIYTDEKLYATDSWLKKPIKTVRDIVPLFADYEKLRVLDLGCGVGRNSIYVAECFKDKDCVVDCVDLLEIAIEKLLENAGERGVATSIRGIQKSIEEYSIEADSYDFIMAISALEHIDTEESFAKKLVEIRDGLRERGVVCLVMNSEVREQNKDTGEMVDAQFEVNISTEKMQEYLREAFEGWSVLKTTVSAQEYDIPREGFVSRLNTNVVTFVARKIRGAIMKTLIFNGSPRANGDTESLLRVVRENIEGEYKVVNAYRCDISACVDCRYCWNEAGCAIQDEMQEVYDYIQECDNILIASPVYFSELTGKLLDVGSRLQTYFCAKFFRKEEPIAKEKRGGVILVGGGDGHLGKAYETACTLLHHVNCHDIHSLVSSHNTNVRPAIEDGVALEGINSILKFFAEKSEG